MTKALFRVGEQVTWTGNPRGQPLRCTVVRVMPVENAIQTYHVRGSIEGFERSVQEITLSKAAPSTLARPPFKT